MEKSLNFGSSAEFDEFLLREGAALAGETARSLSALIPNSPKLAAGPTRVESSPYRSEDGYVASILFMGPVFGEFILSVDRESAETLFMPILEGTSGKERAELVCEGLAEVLNQSAGARMASLNDRFKRMTMSVPKVTEGRVFYRGIRAAHTKLGNGSGGIGVAFYVDQMKTDLADAHREMIERLKNANADLEKVNRRIQEQQTQLVQSEKMASLGIMAAGVAHEINNPLSFVTSNIDTLADYISVTSRLIDGYSNFIDRLVHGEPEDARMEIASIRKIEESEEITYITEDSRKLIEESRSGLDRIRRIVTGLKRFSRQESEDFRPAQVNDEITNTVELLRNELKYRCTVETDLRPVRELHCLPGELSQVFMNLILNAAQAMPGTNGKIRIESREEGDALVLRFIDDGSGMSEEIRGKIFQPFFTTKPVGKGTGLGLAISYGIVEKHGGTIEVESAIGVGSTFTLRFPYAGKRAGAA